MLFALRDIGQFLISLKYHNIKGCKEVDARAAGCMKESTGLSTYYPAIAFV